MNAGTISARMIINIKDFVAGLDESEKKLKSYKSSVQKQSEAISKIGDGISGVGGKLTKGVSLPLVGVGTAATMTAATFEEKMSKVKALSGATGQEFEDLKSLAREMGASTRFSASEAADALSYMGMAGWKSSQMTDALPGVMNLAAASGEDLALVSDIVTDSLSGFGMEAGEAGKFADLLAKTATSSNTNVAMMGETFKYVAPVAGALGYSAEDVALATGLMANSGIKASQAGTTLRGALTRMTSPTEKAAMWMERLGIEVEDANGEMKPLDQLMGEMRGSFGKLSESQQSQAASAIFGKEAMSGMLSIMNATEEDFEDLHNATRNYTGAAEDMSEVMEDNVKGDLIKLKSATEELFISIGELLLPILSDVIEVVQGVVDKFNNLEGETQENILKIGGLAAAFGPFLKVAGGGISIVGDLWGVFGKFSGVVGSVFNKLNGFPLLGKLLPKLFFAPLALGVGALAYKVLDSTGALDVMKEKGSELLEKGRDKVNNFGDTVSEFFTGTAGQSRLFKSGVSSDTKQVADAFIEMTTDAEQSLNELEFGMKEITDETTKHVVDKYAKMKDEVVGLIEEEKDESVAFLEEMFNTTADISEEQKNFIIDQTQKMHERNKKQTEEGYARIEEIMQEAKDNGVGITREMRDEINEIQRDMMETGIDYMAKNAEEQEAMLTDLRVRSDDITAEQAAAVASNAMDAYNETVDAAKATYDESIKQANLLRKDGTIASQKAADELEEIAKKKYDNEVGVAEEMKNDVLKAAADRAEEHGVIIDRETGEIQTKWKRLKEWFANAPIIGKIVGIFKDEGRATKKKLERNATGTSNFGGGYTWVGEYGPELVKLPKSSKIHTTGTSKLMQQEANNNKQPLDITLRSPIFIDGKKIAEVVSQEQYVQEESTLRGRGVVY